MQSFRRLAFFSTLATYFLIFVGGLVRVSGAGLGCPDWPKCYGRWFPPLSVNDLPPDLGATGLTVVLAWIEYFNRLVGVSVGFLILAVAIMALVKYRHLPKILWPSLLAALLVAYQGWQGGKVVTSELEPILVSAHLLLSYLIVSLLIYVTQQTYYQQLPKGEVAPSSYPPQAVFWCGLLWVGGMLQILLGTQVREAIEMIAREFPLLKDSQLLREVGVWNDIHMISGTLMVLFTWFVGYSILKLSHQVSQLVRLALWGMMVLMLVEVLLGIFFYFYGLSPVAQLFHQWAAGLFIGLAMVAFFGVKHTGADVVSYGRSFKRILVPLTVNVVCLALIALFVVEKAEAERTNVPVLSAVPEFQFVERSGQPFGLEELKGKVNIVEFFFTSCRGPCPMMNAIYSELYREFAGSPQLRLVSITVDPATDTLATLREYANRFNVTDDRWVFIRGEMEQVVWLAEKGFGVSGDLPGMHSTKFILVDPRGNIRGYYDYDDQNELKLMRAHAAVIAKEML